MRGGRLRKGGLWTQERLDGRLRTEQGRAGNTQRPSTIRP